MTGRHTGYIAGLTEEQIAPVLAAELAKPENRNRVCLFITTNDERVKAFALTFSFFSSRPVLTVPEDDPFFLDFEAKSRSALNDRLRALISMQSASEGHTEGHTEGSLIIAAATGAIKKLLPSGTFRAHSFTLKTGGSQNLKEAAGRLSAMGYERVPVIEQPGQFAMRGDILDIWTPDRDDPLRVELFGDEVERIRAFDVLTQKSIGKAGGGESRVASIYPAAELIADEVLLKEAAERLEVDYNNVIVNADEELKHLLMKRRDQLTEMIASGTGGQQTENYIGYFTDQPAYLSDYLPEDGLIVVDDVDRIRETVLLREREALDDLAVRTERGDAIDADFDGFSGTEDLSKLYQKREALFFSPLTAKGAQVVFTAKHPPVMGGHLPLLISELKRYRREGFEITIVCSSDERSTNLKDLLSGEDLLEYVTITRGELNTGIELTSEKKVWLWDGDIFHTGRQKKRRSKSLENASPIRSFTDIKKGDFVVHEAHGIGTYEGIERLEVQGTARDYLKIRYAGSDLLYVPADQTSSIQKYIGGGEARPHINKLSGIEWRKAKDRARADIAEMAEELAQLAAERLTKQGHAFSPDTVWQHDFEDRFPYEETGDQLRSIESIKRDMELPRPMDRLLCGDVGYGKTEVAMRAVFKCVCDGKQAAILVPTTILASQHYQTFKKRFDEFPFTVEMLSRFRSKAEQGKILKDLRSGRIDVIIGTHRLLSKDIAYKDLGLLVIDEEQRFGVKHKEKIKELRKDVDVLTLTATPIPRTLHMSLLGVRDMDLIEEPPEDRYPVQTYVMEQSDEIIRETIRRELSRSGQVYVVVPRISAIERVAGEISGLVPEAQVAAGHGRMNETELENVMMDFIAGSYDVLVSTTIIESGIDIPNVNTILIIDADHFGLSQLYQLRGRVGRTNRIAFAYLLFKRDKVLTEVAEKRLRTIREFTEFGAGFKIAMRDLEIRGAGNLLGSAQHGHMAAVGYDMYCRLVDEAVQAITSGGASGTDGARGAAALSPEEEIEVKVDLPVSAYIPDSYIEDETLRLEAYRDISLIGSRSSAKELLAELEDRFGSVPVTAVLLVKVALARNLAKAAGLARIHLKNGNIIFTYASADTFRPERVVAAATDFEDRFVLSGTTIPALRLKRTGQGAALSEQEMDEILTISERLV
ncbi:MAG: transcription-repair coupling factor [Clostridiales Family XIII bacterium]|jgi:transcription-repair coupling factor (superfamily II helicase)|nr:transcription-repair coupling factor [Clostridiales Family XIII bacterium]